jgi:glycosyltransferase involved in cell wall biosynthesis
MNVCVVGGIFDKDAAYRRIHQQTPETILVDGLRSRGIAVRSSGHLDFVPRAGEIVHVHHIGRAAVSAAGARHIAGLAVTPHDGRLISGGTHHPLSRRLAWRFAASWADAIVALSAREAHAFGRVADHARIVVIPNGIPYVPAEDATAAPPPYLLYVGQLIPLKGVADLLAAFARLAPTVAEMQLWLAYHNAQDEAVLKAEAQRQGIEERVRFLGAQNQAALRVLYRDAVCTVLPSYAEALPSALIEAQLQGCPVVATDVGDTASIVGDPTRLVKPGDVEGLARVLGTMLADHASRHPEARTARRDRMREQFGVARMIDAHVALYTRLADMRQHRVGRTLIDLGARVVLPVKSAGLHTLDAADPA